MQAVGLCGGGPGRPGFTWESVSEAMQGERSKLQCRMRWSRYLQPAALGEDPASAPPWTMQEVRIAAVLC